MPVTGAARQPTTPNERIDPALLVRFARAHRTRAHFFPDRMFADGAWRMLIELYLSHVEGRPISVSGLAAISGVPDTSALRIIDCFVADGLATRALDPLDARRRWLTLTPIARDKLEAWLCLCLGIFHGIDLDEAGARIQVAALGDTARDLGERIEDLTGRIAAAADRLSGASSGDVPEAVPLTELDAPAASPARVSAPQGRSSNPALAAATGPHRSNASMGSP